MRASERDEIERLLRASTSSSAESSPERGVDDEAVERSGELVRIARGDEEAGFAVGDLLGDTADTRGNDGNPCGHRLQYGDRKTFRCARKNEEVRIGEQLRDVAALASQVDAIGQLERLDLLLQEGAVGSLADDHGIERVGRERAESPDQCRKILRRLQSPNREDQRPLALDGSPERRTCYVHRIRDHDRPLGRAGTSRQSCLALPFRDADRERGQRLDDPVGESIQPGREARVSREGPAVHGEDPNRNTSEESCHATEHAGLRAARMEDVRPLPPQQARDLDEADEIAPGADRPSDAPQRNEASAHRLGGLAEWTASMRGNDHVELIREGREERRDVGLRSADLGQRDEQQHPGPAAGGN